MFYASNNILYYKDDSGDYKLGELKWHTPTKEEQLIAQFIDPLPTHFSYMGNGVVVHGIPGENPEILTWK
jgi:hypothetical protein